MELDSPLRSILDQIAAITRMEAGKLCITGEGPNGPYFNFQCWRQGRNFTEYVPAAQLEALRTNIEAHQQFKELIARYEALVTEQTRAERKAGALKKKRRTSRSPSRRKPKSRP